MKERRSHEVDLKGIARVLESVEEKLEMHTWMLKELIAEMRILKKRRRR